MPIDACGSLDSLQLRWDIFGNFAMLDSSLCNIRFLAYFVQHTYAPELVQSDIPPTPYCAFLILQRRLLQMISTLLLAVVQHWSEDI